MAKPASGTALDTGSPLYTGLTNAWGLLEGSGSTTADSKGGITATISGGVTWTTDADGPLLVGNGVSGQALLPSVIYLHTGETTGPWTIAWRAKQTGGSTPVWVMGSVADGYSISMQPGSWLEVFAQSACQFTGVTDFSALDDYMVIADGSTNISLYHNGSLVSILTGKDTRCGFKAFCGMNTTNFFGGNFSYFYVWEATALTGTDAATLHSSPYSIFVSGDTTPPVVSSANVNAAGTTLTITFTEAGSPPVLPASSVTGFTLKAGGVTTGTLTSTAISSLTYTATTGRTITAGETLTLDYAPGNVTDSASPPNSMLTFSGTSVTNNSTQPGVATTLTLTGPTSGTVSVASTNFTVTPNGTATDVVTFHSSGSGSFSNSPITFAGSSTPQTSTYIPSTTAGSPHVISITDSALLAIVGSPINYTVNSASPHAYTSQRAGDWNVASGTSTSPWYDGGTQSGWNSVPSASNNDTIASNIYDITFTSDISIGNGTASVVLPCTAGTLTGTGCKLTIRGNASVGPTTLPAPGTPTVARLSMVSSVGSAAGIELDGNSGVTPTITIHYNDYLSIVGNASHHSYLRTKSGSAGSNGMIISGQIHQSGSFYLSYIDISYMGGGNFYGINCAGLDSYSFNATGFSGYFLDNFTIDHCGVCPFLSIGSFSGPETVSLTNGVWTNPTDTSSTGYTVAGGQPAIIAIRIPPTTGIRLIQNCSFVGANDYVPVINLAGGIISDVYFDNNIFGFIEGGQCAVMDGVFIRMQDMFESSHAGSQTNSFRLEDNVSGDPLSLGDGDAHYDSTYAYNIQMSLAENYFMFSNAESGDQNIFMVVCNNINLPAANGDDTGALCCLISRPDSPSSYYFRVEHNTKFCHRQPLLYQQAERAGCFTSVRSNLGWNTGSTGLTTNTAIGVPLLSSYLVQYVQNQGYTWVLDSGVSSIYDYNGWHDLTTVAAGTFTTPLPPVPVIPGATSYTDGTVYFIPMSSGAAPGTHDVANVNPNFVDSTRNLLTWSVARGYALPGDSALTKKTNALAAIRANPLLTKTDLLPYTRAGFAPTNGAYLNAGHDGKDIGCIVGGGITILVSPYSPMSLPTNHAGQITLWLVGTGTNWSGSPLGISGVAGCTLVSQTVITPTVASIKVTTGATAGTLAITDGTFTVTIVVDAPTLEVRPARLTAGSGSQPMVAIGVNTAWYQETTAPLFTVSGGTGASISGIAINFSNNWANFNLNPGSTAGTLTIHEAVSGSTATVLVGSAAATLAVSPTHAGIINAGTTPVTLTGTHTTWASYALTTPLFLSGDISGPNFQVVLYNIAVLSDTLATATIGHVSQTGDVTLTDQSTNATHVFTIDSGFSFILSPGRTTQAGGSITVTAVGNGTGWTGATPSTLFSIAGGSGSSISSTSVINNTLATFSLNPGSVPASLVITDTSTNAVVTFLVTGTGTHVDIGSTTLSPPSGSGPVLAAGWSGVPGLYWAAFLRNVASDAVSPYNAAWQAFAAATQGPTIRTSFYGAQPDASGLSTGYGNMAVGMPLNQVPGNLPAQPVNFWEYPTNSDPGPVPLWPAMSIEGWPFGSDNADNAINGFVAVTNGSANVTGSGTNFTLLQPGDRICFAIYGVSSPPAPTFYTVASVTNDTALVLTANYGQTSHIFADTLELYGPFNRPPTYAWTQATGGDTRALILVRDETSGLPTKLWELYKPSYDPGSGWQSGASAYWDLTTGIQRKDGWTSDTAGGTPCMPFLVRWEEANSGTISHPLRCAIASGLGSANKCIWPATHAASASGVDFTAGTVPLGSVIRLNAAWLAANRASFPAIVRPVLDAAATYGLHVNDYTSGTPFEIDWEQDSRWNRLDITTLWAIPVTAFELVDSIKPQYTLAISAAPYATGNPITFTVAYVGDTAYSNGNTNFDPVTVYVAYSTDGGVTWTLSGGTVTLTTSTRSSTCTFTPGSSGNYLFKTIQASGVWWLPGAMVSAAVSATGRALTAVQNGRWDDPATWGDTPPAYGDTATIAHAVTMIGNSAIGSGSGAALTMTGGGTLAVVGCTLTVRGTISGTGASAVNSAGNTGSIVFSGSATTYTITPPSPPTGRPAVASGDFTIQLDGIPTSAVTITPNDSGNSGTFTPSSLLISDANSHTFKYTASSVGSKTIGCTNNGGLTNPGSVTFTAYTLVLVPTSQSVANGVDASLTATLTGGAGSLSAFSVGGTLSTSTPTSGVAFTLAVPGSGSGTDQVFVSGPGGTTANSNVSYPPPVGQPGSMMMMGMGS